MSLYIFDKEFDRNTHMGLSFDSEVMKTWICMELLHVGENPEPVIIFRDKALCTVKDAVVRTLYGDLIVVFQVNKGLNGIRLANVTLPNSEDMKSQLDAIFNFPTVTLKFERDFFSETDSSEPIGTERSEITIATSVLSIFVFPAANYEGSWEEGFRKNPQSNDDPDFLTYLDMVKDPRDKTLKDSDPNK